MDLIIPNVGQNMGAGGRTWGKRMQLPPGVAMYTHINY